MIEGWAIILLAFAYVGGLFALAWYADRTFRSRKGDGGRPVIYALSLAVYCTSWTFFGSVGFAASTGYTFFAVYLGPILLFALGWPLLVRIVRLAKSQNITSIADFLAARYGKSQAVGAIVTVIAVLGSLPYIALQLKAVALSVTTLLGALPLQLFSLRIDTALVIALAMAAFAVLFGTRHIDATEHQEGLIVAVAAESLVKLAAFLTVGIFVVFSVFGGIGPFLARAAGHAEVQRLFASELNVGYCLTVTFLSLVCIVLLPRQFHVTVVENNSENEVRRAAWLFPVYLVLINLFVVPIAAAGLMTLKDGFVTADMFVLGLPLAERADAVTLLAFVGGLSAATAMVIVESVALAIMVCNGLAVPLLLRGRADAARGQLDMAWRLLVVRRAAIFAIILFGYLFYLLIESGRPHALVSIGLVSFAAIAQFAPAFFGGLVWRRATATGAIAGIVTGFAVWSYTLLLPWIIEAGWLPRSIMSEGPFGLVFLAPQALFHSELEPLTHGVLWSMAANVAMYVAGSLLRGPEPVERLQAHLFALSDLPRPPVAPPLRMWRSSITTGELQRTVARYLGDERAERSFQEYAQGNAAPLAPNAEADIHLVRFTEHLLASAIGAASSRLVLSLLLRRSDAGSHSALKLLDDATEALQYNRDLLQSALDQVRHGLSVFDRNMQLICWNRQFRELLGLPAELGRVGAPLDQILRVCAERGDFGATGDVTAMVAERLVKLAVTHETFQEHFDGGRRILEIRTAPMPQGGIVTTYSDITERVEAAEALARVNETLERRVQERTVELTDVNNALAIAKRKADEANLDKTRFLAAASHDVLQPLNAARLYATSLVERHIAASEAQLVRNIDASLEAVEEILNVLIEIARLDTGRMEPDITVFPLNDVFERLGVEFQPLAREKGLDLRIVCTGAWVLSDRRLLRRMLQNLVSNAIKYTGSGRVLLGVRRIGDRLSIQVHDTGPGIPITKRSLIFKEFQRLEETAHSVRGLGLGLAIVERIGKVLEHPIALQSATGGGSLFAVALPRAEPQSIAQTGIAMAPTLGQLSGLSVLCIDNEPDVLNALCILLEGWGCTVIAAESGAEASAHLRQADGRADIILADYHLDGSTGLEAVAALRADLKTQPPVIVITADHSAEVQRAVRARGYALLRKPLKAAALRALMFQLARQRPAVAAE
jgi:Na+/proline symporter/signal transduction histidine kinase/ActR/RegA family two-component response regulator